jgi:hypothetical protein
MCCLLVLACLPADGHQKLFCFSLPHLLRCLLCVQNAGAEHSLLSSDPSAGTSPRPVAAAAASKAPPRAAAKAAAAGRKALKDALKQQAVAKKSQAAAAAQNSGGGGAGAFGAAGSDGADADSDLFARYGDTHGSARCAYLAVRNSATVGGFNGIAVQHTDQGKQAWLGQDKQLDGNMLLVWDWLACASFGAGRSTVLNATTPACMVLCHAVCPLQHGPAYWVNHGHQQPCSCSGGSAAGQARSCPQERPLD